MRRIVNLVIFALLPALPLAAIADGMTLEQVAKLRQVSQVSISPDGRHIAYSLSVPRKLFDEDDGPAWNELHVIGREGERRPFVTGQVNVGAIGWTPDSREITYLSNGEGEKQALYAIPVDGGGARKLVELEEGVRDYSFSPDGKRVALLGFEPDAEELKKEREQGFTQIVFEEDWKPVRLWLHELGDGDGAAEPEMIELDGSVQEVQWSPAGDRLAIKITPRELIDDVLMFNRIRILDLEGNELGRIDNPGKLGGMAWSPDGERLAFIATESIRDTREGRLMVAGKRGGEFTPLLPGLAGHVWSVGWLDNGRIVFVSHEGTGARLGTIEPGGRNQDTLLAAGGPIWRAISVSENGTIAAVADTPGHPAEAWRLAPGTAAPERLTDSNAWLSDIELARQEVVTYEARDGLQIEGILFYPLNYREGQRYPLILAVHGGPEAHYSNGWLTSYASPADVAADRGYFMFFQNYRGSTGRGVEFAETSQGRPAAEEFDDLVDGVDHLIEQGMVDGDRVGITGGSYGGYASAWGATYYSERFAAAVMNVGLSEKISMLGTSDIPQEFYLVHDLVWPWDDWEWYLKASPVYYVQQAETPILILHGDSDPRVDPTQSKILYRYLTLQENPPPVRLVLYRGEGHGNRRAAPRYDYSLRLMRWMDHYLKGEGGDPPEYRLDYGIPDD